MINCSKCHTLTHERSATLRMGFVVCQECDHVDSDAEFAQAMGLDCTVMLHGFTQLNEDTQEHCDFDSPECDGWNVWLRVETPHDTRQPFDGIDSVNRDFTSLHAARQYADSTLGEWNCEYDEY